MAPRRLFAELIILAGVLSTAVGGRGDEPGLQVGDAVPEFRSVDDRGETWNSRDHIGKQIVVIYFYPSDFSFSCTRQAVRYRDHISDLSARGVEVIGISCDVVQAHRLFKAIHTLNYTLLADEDGSVAQQFRVPLRVGGKAVAQDASGLPLVDEKGKPVQLRRDFTAARWTFVIGKDGRIIYRESQVSPLKDSQQVLNFIDQASVK